MKIDLIDSENFCPEKEMDIGIATRIALSNAEISTKQKFLFHCDCRRFFIRLVGKVVELCPLRNSFIRNVASLSSEIVLQYFKKFFKSMAPPLIQSLSLLRSFPWPSRRRTRFSVIKEILLPNMRDDSLITQRQVHNATLTYGGAAHIPLTQLLSRLVGVIELSWKISKGKQLM
jgi:hypothetical protein